MSAQLSYPFSAQWYSKNGISVIGHAWLGDELMRTEVLAGLFESVSSKSQFTDTLNKLNGFFAVVIDLPEIHAAAVDHIRSYPILYRNKEHDFKVLSHYDWEIDYKLDRSVAEVFQNSWCAPDNRTLVQEVHQLSAGQYLWSRPNLELTAESYYFQYRQKDLHSSRSSLHAKALEVFDKVFARTLKELAGRHALIPLSGGYDSRLILAMLVRSGYDKITAYTYGDPDGHEAQIAAKVAKQLKVDWHFIEYNEKLFEEFFSPDWQAYSSGNHFFTSLPHEQDYFALHQMREKGLLPDDFVALPGFCGDVLGGSVTAYKPKEWTGKALRNMIASKVLNSQYTDVSLSGVIDIKDKESFYDAYQQWYVSNKESKFIVNAVRVFEHFGGRWTMPFWDRELSDFWYAVPYNLREKQLLYNEVLFSEYFEPLGIGFYKPGYDDNYPHQLKEQLKEHLPGKVKKLLRKVKPGKKGDVNRLEILNNLICQQMGDSNSSQREVNISHARYFLNNLNK